MKKIIGIFIFVTICFSLFAQKNKTNESVLAYRNACIYFENKDYGKALKYSDDAINFRKNQIESEYKLLTTSFSSKEVKKAGDKISDVLLILEERGEIDCIELINFYINKKGIDFFKNSITNLLEYILKQKEYPEAQKLIGDIYKIEGEYDFAEEYYKKALRNEDVLDIPDEKYEILYLLADISYLKNENDKYEVRLLNIIGSTQTNKNKLLIKSIKNTLNTDVNGNVNKLFTLYRTYDYYSMNAYSKLADYYYKLGENEKAFDYSAIAMLNGFSRICSIIEKRDLDYTFTDLESFFDAIPNYSDIMEWGIENHVWKNFNVFSNLCAELGYIDFSMELLKIIAFHSPEKYWQQEAVLKLDTLDGIKNPEEE